MDKVKLAPIVLFVYNRLDHTKKTVKALQNNKLAIESNLVIYSDAPKNIHDELSVNDVRKFIKTIDGFKDVIVFERPSNFGLARNIIDGVTKIIHEHGNIIVLEDDLITSPYFLNFMNDALDAYNDEKSVWEVGGYVYPISYEPDRDFFFSPYTTSWGWATWSDRWDHFERDPLKLVSTLNKQQIKKFNLDNSDNIWGQVLANADEKLFTWAVFWYATVFLNNGLTIFPKKSMVENIGHDGSGDNCIKSSIFEVSLSDRPLNLYTTNADIDKIAFDKVKKFLKKNNRFINKVKNRIKSFFL
jgi:hypothetical protein